MLAAILASEILGFLVTGQNIKHFLVFVVAVVFCYKNVVQWALTHLWVNNARNMCQDDPEIAGAESAKIPYVNQFPDQPDSLMGQAPVGP